MSFRLSNALYASLTALAVAGATAAFAAGSESVSHGDGQSQNHGLGKNSMFGQPGQASAVSRTIEVTMGDNYFEPEKLEIETGETIRFVVINNGEFLHEFNIGMAAMHVEHQKEMMVMMEHGMLTATGIDHDMMKMNHNGSDMSGHAHDGENSVLLEPGKTEELIWTFAEATAGLEFACNVPGHYDAGMMGEIEFVKRGKTDG